MLLGVGWMRSRGWVPGTRRTIRLITMYTKPHEHRSLIVFRKDGTTRLQSPSSFISDEARVLFQICRSDGRLTSLNSTRTRDPAFDPGSERVAPFFLSLIPFPTKKI